MTFLLILACAAPEPPAPRSHGVFGGEVVHRATLMLAPTDLEALLDGATAPRLEKTWFSGSLTWDDATVGEVGVRAKGRSKRLLARDGAVPLKLDFDRFEPGRNLHGLEKLNLHSTPADGSGIREALAHAVWHEAGVPAARTGFAKVVLNGRDLGTWVTVEDLGETWLAGTFPPGDGVLYKPDAHLVTGPALGGLAPGWLRAGEDPGNTRITALVEALHGPTSAWEAATDVDALILLLAGDAALGNGDSFARSGRNYYLYAPAAGAFTWIPWDLDRTWTATGLCPGDTRRNPAWRGVVSDPALETRYRDTVRRMLEGPAHPDRLADHADRLVVLGVTDRQRADTLVATIRSHASQLLRALDAGETCAPP